MIVIATYLFSVLATTVSSPVKKIENDVEIDEDPTIIPPDDLQITPIPSLQTYRAPHSHHGGPPPAPPPESQSLAAPNTSPPRPANKPPPPPGSQSIPTKYGPSSQHNINNVDISNMQNSSDQDISVVEPEIEIPREPSPPPANIPDPPPDLPEVTDPDQFIKDQEDKKIGTTGGNRLSRATMDTKANLFFQIKEVRDLFCIIT